LCGSTGQRSAAGSSPASLLIKKGVAVSVRNMLPLLASALLGAALFLASSCVTPIEGLEHDPTFTHRAVCSERMIVGGVTSAVSAMSPADRSRYADLLRRQFLALRKAYPISTAGTLSQALGAERYNRLLDDYRVHGQLSADQMRELKAAGVGERYAAFVRVERDESRSDRDEENGSVYGKAKQDKDRKTIVLKTTRECTATLTIYDLVAVKPVWRGAVEQSVSHSDTHTSEEGDEDWEDAVLTAVIGGLFGLSSEKDAEAYPQPASLDEVLRDVFRGFAENMPEAPK